MQIADDIIKEEVLHVVLYRNYADIVKILNMERFYPKSLSWMDIMTISGKRNNETCLKFIEQIVMLDQNALLTDFAISSSNGMLDSCASLLADDNVIGRKPNRRKSKSTNSIHLMDVVNVVLNCCDNVLLQILIEKLFTLQLSIPLIFPIQDNGLTCLLWSLRGIVPEGKTGYGSPEALSLVDIPLPYISFMRIGHLKQSKSKLINSLLRSTQYDTYFHRDCKNGDSIRNLSEGTVEATWFQPSMSVKNEKMYGILNLRGEASKYSEQCCILSEISSLIFVMINVTSMTSDPIGNFLKKIQNTKANVILVVLAETMDEASSYDADIAFSKYDTEYISEEINNWSDGALWNATVIIEEIRDVINRHLDQPVSKIDLENIANTARRIGNCCVDEDDPRISKARKKMERIIGYHGFQSILATERKAILLPLQGEHWKTWGELQKEQYRNKNLVDSPEEYTSQKIAEQNEARLQQFNLIQNGKCEFAEKICLQLQAYRTRLSRQYFSTWMQLKLDDSSRKVMPKLQKNYEDRLNADLLKIDSSSEMLESELVDLDIKLRKTSFGLENVFRELGQMYEAVKYSSSSVGNDILKSYNYCMDLPRTMANLVLQGISLELMDGDTSFVPVMWLKAIFKEIQGIVGNEVQIYVVSIVGLQSSGKSTVLNTMFGLKFP